MACTWTSDDYVAWLANQDIDGSAILNKANQFARNLNIVDFKGSEGWLSGLKERVGISQKTKHGESLSAPSQEEIECERLKLHDLLNNWKPEDIYLIVMKQLFIGIKNQFGF